METTKDDQMREINDLVDREKHGWPYDDLGKRSDEQAQSQDRERLQSEIQEAWDKYFWHDMATEADIKLLKWALGVK
jgi:hypothetical protein